MKAILEKLMQANGIKSLYKQNETEEETMSEEPTQTDRIEAQVMYTALMTDTLLEVE